MCKFFKVFFTIVLKICVILSIAFGVLFVVYFFNLDQKVLDWIYAIVNRVFDRKKQDNTF